MADARVLVAFAAILALCLFFIERGVKPAFAPMCAVGMVALWVPLFGCLGALWVGTLLLYIACAAALLWVLWRWVIKKVPVPALGVGPWFFAVAGLVSILLLWAKQPMFLQWDEFSFWGTAPKLMKLFNQMYTTAPMGWIWTASYAPTPASLSYFVQFFGDGFIEWQTYAACNLLLFAAMAAATAPIGKKNIAVAAPLFGILLLLPYFIQYYGQMGWVTGAYMDSQGDIPLGFAFAAALCCTLGRGEEEKGLAAFLPVAISVAVLALTKETGAALALVVCVLAAGVGLAGMLARKSGWKPALKKHGLQLVCLVAVVAAVFVAWTLYLSAAAGVNRVADVGGKEGAGMLQLPALFIKDLLAPQKSEFFVQVCSGMWNQFVSSRSTMLGSGLVIAALCCGLAGLAAVVAPAKPQRVRSLAYGVLAALGFVAYYLLILMTYLYLFRTSQALALESFNRYMYPYYIGWLLGAVLLLCQSLAGARPKRRAAGAAVVLLLCVGMFVRTAQLIPVRFSIVGVNPSEYNERREFAKEVGALCQQLDIDGRTFFVKTDDDGFWWFQYSFQMLPYQLDYSSGGGVLENRTQDENGGTVRSEMTIDDLSEYLVQNGCTTVYLNTIDDDFRQKFAPLFADGLAAYDAGKTQLYAVEQGYGWVRLVPQLPAG